MTWSNARVLVTGGLGFVGSNLCRELLAQGAKVTAVDNMLPDHGGNLFNIHDIKDKLTVNFADVCSPHAMNHLVQQQDYIFHLAGQVNHIASMQNPLSDLQINTQGTLTLLEACRQYNAKAKIVFSGTRGSYGRTSKLPVSETHPSRPMGVYAVTNAAAEQLLQVYHDTFNIRSVCLRITNTFGPRHQMKHNQYGVANWFLRQAIDDESITVMGDGSIQRDYLFISDLIGGLLAAAESDDAYGQVINLGRGEPTTFSELASAVVKSCKRGNIAYVPFSDARLSLEPGHYVADITKAKKYLNWQPRVSIADGLDQTVAFYDTHRDVYWS